MKKVPVFLCVQTNHGILIILILGDRPGGVVRLGRDAS